MRFWLLRTMIYKPTAVHPMNRELSRMARRSDIIHDVDCIYRNTARNFWLCFEWKNPGERMGSAGTMSSLTQLDMAMATTGEEYRGLFIVRLGFSIDTWPLDDTQQIEVVRMRDGEVLEEATYPTGARSAVEYILEHGKL